MWEFLLSHAEAHKESWSRTKGRIKKNMCNFSELKVPYRHQQIIAQEYRHHNFDTR